MCPSLSNKAIVKNAHGLKWKIPRGWGNKKLEKFKLRRKMQKKSFTCRWSCDAVEGIKKGRKFSLEVKAKRRREKCHSNRCSKA